MLHPGGVCIEHRTRYVVCARILNLIRIPLQEAKEGNITHAKALAEDACAAALSAGKSAVAAASAAHVVLHAALKEHAPAVEQRIKKVMRGNKCGKCLARGCCTLRSRSPCACCGAA